MRHTRNNPDQPQVDDDNDCDCSILVGGENHWETHGATTLEHKQRNYSNLIEFRRELHFNPDLSTSGEVLACARHRTIP